MWIAIAAVESASRFAERRPAYDRWPSTRLSSVRDLLQHPLSADSSGEPGAGSRPVARSILDDEGALTADPESLPLSALLVN